MPVPVYSPPFLLRPLHQPSLGHQGTSRGKLGQSGSSFVIGYGESKLILAVISFGAFVSPTVDGNGGIRFSPPDKIDGAGSSKKGNRRRSK
jgi:hypothetical protein